MKRWLPLVLLLLIAPGCSTKPNVATWWNPFTWASRLAPASVDAKLEKRDEAEAKVEKFEDKVVHAANVEVGRALEVLQSAPDSRPVQLAKRFTGNAYSLLNQVQPLSIEESTDIRGLVADLLSENQRVRDAAEKVMDHAEKTNAKLGDELSSARASLERREAALAAANANLRDAYDRENALANQVRNFWFIAGGLAFLWVAGNVLGAVAKVYPPLAPVSRAINGIASPMLAFAEARAADGLRKVGQAVKLAREKIPHVAEQFAEFIDGTADEDQKRIIAAGAGKTYEP